MNSINIIGTDLTPSVVLSKEENTFLIQGRAVPMDGEAFFKPILDWMENYAENPLPTTVFTFEMEFMNLSSSKMLLFILYKLKEIRDNGYDVMVNWQHLADDCDMIEVGEDYEFMVDIPFKFKAIDYNLALEELVA